MPGQKENQLQAMTEPGPVTTGHLLLVTTFMMPVVGAIGDLKHAHGRLLQWTIGLAAALALGVVLVRVEWECWKQITIHGQRYSVRARNWLGVRSLLQQIGWIAVGGILGFRLTKAVLTYIR